MISLPERNDLQAKSSTAPERSDLQTELIPVTAQEIVKRHMFWKEEV